MNLSLIHIFASAWAALTWTGVPGGLRILCAILMGFVFGGLWALIAALFKAKLGISEIIVTIMLNYIAINFLGIAVRTFLMDPAGSIPQSPKLLSLIHIFFQWACLPACTALLLYCRFERKVLQ